jgi:uncharacterized phage-like protein YoqJ
MIVAFTGHRPERLGEDSAGAWIAIKEFLLEQRPERVISGMTQGVDSLAFDIALELGIPVVAAVPWTGHGIGWTEKQLDEYLKRLERAVEVKVTSDTQEYRPWVYTIRDRWMVDNSDLLVAVWDGVRIGGTWNTIEYSRKLKREPTLLKWRAK